MIIGITMKIIIVAELTYLRKSCQVIIVASVGDFLTSKTVLMST